jgi:hypothetical protein
MVVLQNCMGFLKAEPGSCSETCLTSSHDDNQVIHIKVEERKDVEEEDPLLIPFTPVKAEYEVSILCVSC